MMLRNYREGDLLHVRLGTDFGATDRYAECRYLDGHSDCLTLIDCTGRELTGNVVSARLMTDEERAEWSRYESERAYEAAYRAANPAVMARVVLVLLAAAEMRPVVTVRGEEVRGAA